MPRISETNFTMWVEHYRCRLAWRWRNLGCAAVLILSCTLGNLLLISHVDATQETDCTDVDFIYIRGSGASLDSDVNYEAWQHSIEAATQDIMISKRFYNLGMEEHGGYQYPAVAVGGNLQGYLNLVTAYFSAGRAAEFGKSVEQGRGELIYYMIDRMQQCPNTKFVLGGYSQGAMIISMTLQQLYAPRIIYAATFGDPKIYLPEGKREAFTTPQACRGVNLSPYREYVPDCYAYTGVLGSVQPYQPVNYAGKLGTWCNDLDIMCSSGLSASDHSKYIANGLYDDAAQVIREKLQETFPDRVIKTEKTNDNPHDLVLVFDATGSMSNWLPRFLKEAIDLASKVTANGGQYSLFKYSDLLDGGKHPEEACDKSCSIEELKNKISNIVEFYDGNKPESMLAGVYYAMTEYEWTPGATKSLVVFTDAGYHIVDGDGTTLEKVIAKSIEIDPVNIYVITTDDAIMSEYAEITEKTSGGVFKLSSNGKNVLSNPVLGRPVAKLALERYYGFTGEVFQFDASESYSLNGEALEYEWDFDGDGVFEEKSTNAKITKVYNQEFTGYVQVRVSDSYGRNTMSAPIEVKAVVAEELPSINNLSAKQLDDDNNYQISFTTDADKVLLSINNMILGFTELNNGAGVVTIADTFDNMEVTLIPYTKDDVRGVSKSVILRENDDRDVELPDLSKGDPDEGSNGNNSGGNKPSAGLGDADNNVSDAVVDKITNTSQNAINKLPHTEVIIPKVPDTGIRNKKINH